MSGVRDNGAIYVLVFQNAVRVEGIDHRASGTGYFGGQTLEGFRFGYSLVWEDFEERSGRTVQAHSEENTQNCGGSDLELMLKYTEADRGLLGHTLRYWHFDNRLIEIYRDIETY